MIEDEAVGRFFPDGVMGYGSLERYDNCLVEKSL